MRRMPRVETAPTTQLHSLQNIQALYLEIVVPRSRLRMQTGHLHCSSTFLSCGVTSMTLTTPSRAFASD